MRRHETADPRMKLTRGRSRRNSKIEPVNLTSLDKAVRPNQRGLGLSGPGGSFDDREPLVQGQRERSDLSGSRVATVKEIVGGSSAVPVGPSRASKNVGCK